LNRKYLAYLIHAHYPSEEIEKEIDKLMWSTEKEGILRAISPSRWF